MAAASSAGRRCRIRRIESPRFAATLRSEAAWVCVELKGLVVSPTTKRYQRGESPHKQTKGLDRGTICRHWNSGAARPSRSRLGERYAGIVVASRSHVLPLEDSALTDPLEGAVEGLLRVRLEQDALARSPPPRVGLREEALGKLVAVVLRVQLRPQVDVALGKTQRPEVLLHVLRIGSAGEHGRHHEGGVDHLAEAELLEEVVGAAEERRRRHLAVHQLRQPREEDSVRERQLDVGKRQVLLQRLEGRVVAARLEADGDGNAAQIL